MIGPGACRLAQKEYRPGAVEGALLRFGTVGELLAMLWRGGRPWMVPLVVVLMLIGLALVFTQSAGVFAPFIYVMG